MRVFWQECVNMREFSFLRITAMSRSAFFTQLNLLLMAFSNYFNFSRTFIQPARQPQGRQVVGLDLRRRRRLLRPTRHAQGHEQEERSVRGWNDGGRSDRS